MRSEWLQQCGSDQLILVFGGWALGPGVFAPLSGAGDVMFVEDYRVLDFDPPSLEGYAQVSLLAYSFGVASALHWLAERAWQPDRLVAVNGTAFPADREKGIAPALVDATAEGLSPSSFARFVRRCGGIPQVPDIDIKARQAELRAIAARGAAPERAFDRVWISDADQIIPTTAQRAAWRDQPGVVREVSAPHQPFGAGQTWEAWLA